MAEAGITAFDWADSTLVPTELIAATLNVYRPAGRAITRVLAVAGWAAEMTGGAPVGFPVVGSTGVAVTR